jgi:RES domain-containing protein
MVVYRLYRRALGVGLDGVGGRYRSGRWNVKGRATVYCAGSAALAILERLVQVDPELLPADLMLARIEIPVAVGIEAIESFASLPRRWQSLAALSITRRIGSSWLAAKSAAVLRVPSAIVPEESNFLLNPAHPEYPPLAVQARRGFRFDSRLFV